MPKPTELVSGIRAAPPELARSPLGRRRRQLPRQRWSDVVKLLTPIVNDPDLDEAFTHAAKITLGIALARLGMFAPALSYLEEPDGPVAVAAVDGALAKALVLRAHVDEESAEEVLQDLYAANPENEEVEHALLDTSFGMVTTTADRIAARTDPWDPETEPSPGEFVDPGAQERKRVLLAEAERELDEFIGLDKVKDQVSRLKSAVAMELVRKQRGLEVAQRTHHLVFTGPPGTGKTTIARVVAKIYCGLGLLKRENIREVHRADLIGQHIGETEAKTNAIIDSALDGVLFLDEAYALVATGAKNDFGLVAIDTLLARMENDRDRLVVIIAGYRADLDRFLDTNQGLRSRFTRSIDFPSYKPAELIEIANFMAAKRDSVFDQAALHDLEALFAHLASTIETRRGRGGTSRPGHRRQRPVRPQRRRKVRRGTRIPVGPLRTRRNRRVHRRGTDDDHRRRRRQLGRAAAARPRPVRMPRMTSKRAGGDSDQERTALVHVTYPGQRQPRQGCLPPRLRHPAPGDRLAVRDAPDRLRYRPARHPNAGRPVAHSVACGADGRAHSGHRFGGLLRVLAHPAQRIGGQQRGARRSVDRRAVCAGR